MSWWGIDEARASFVTARPVGRAPCSAGGPVQPDCVPAESAQGNDFLGSPVLAERDRVEQPLPLGRCIGTGIEAWYRVDEPGPHPPCLTLPLDPGPESETLTGRGAADREAVPRAVLPRDEVTKQQVRSVPSSLYESSRTREGREPPRRCPALLQPYPRTRSTWCGRVAVASLVGARSAPPGDHRPVEGAEVEADGHR